MAYGCAQGWSGFTRSGGLSAKAETTRQKLLNDANNVIKDWRSELTLGIISDETKSL